MSPNHFKTNRLERKRRAVRPDEPASTFADRPSAPYALGYPRHGLLWRALLPIGLIILLFFNHGCPRSVSHAPRPAEPELVR